MKKRRHNRQRQGGLVKSLTKDVEKYIVVYVDVAGEETKTLGTYSSFKDAKYALEQQDTNVGVFHILSDTNRALYSTKGGGIDAK